MTYYEEQYFKMTSQLAEAHQTIGAKDVQIKTLLDVINKIQNEDRLDVIKAICYVVLEHNQMFIAYYKNFYGDNK